MNWFKKILSGKNLDGLSPHAIEDLNKTSWRRGNSKWLWIVWGLAGGYGIPLIVQGARFRSPRMVLAGTISFILLVMALSSVPTTEDSDVGLGGSEILFIFSFLLSIFLAIWGAHYLNRDVLIEKVRRAHRLNDDWVSSNFGVASSKAEPLRPVMNSQTETVLESAGLIEDEAIRAEGYTPELVDVNSASIQSLIGSGALSDNQVMQLVSRRETQQFQSIDEVRVFLDLKPHEFAKVRKLLQAQLSSPTSPEKSAGRIVDL